MPLFGEQFGEQNLSLYRKNNGVHLCQHEVVGEVCINPTDQPFRTVSHPDVHDVRADVLLADRCKRVAEIILRDSEMSYIFSEMKTFRLSVGVDDLVWRRLKIAYYVAIWFLYL